MNEVRFYKPNKAGNGAASKLELRVKTVKKDDQEKSWQEVMLFWVSAQQGPEKDGNASFFWDQKDKKQVTLKLGDIDAGEILAVLNNRKEEVGTGKGLYHQNQNGNSSMSFKKGDNGYYVRVSSQDKDRNLIAIQHTLTWAEGEILRVMLTEFIRRSIF